MTNSKEKNLRTIIHELVQDMVTNETAILLQSNEFANKYKVVSYSKIELGGDSIHIIENMSEELIELDKILITSTIENRKAIWTFLTKALS